jgi:hypothetical protein
MIPILFAASEPRTLRGLLLNIDCGGFCRRSFSVPMEIENGIL